MNRYNRKFEALGFYQLTHANRDANFFLLRIYHMHDSLENEYVLLLHFFYLKLKGCS